MKILGIKHKAFSLIEMSVVVLVISVLIAGIMQSRKLSSRANLANARSLTANSPVASLGDLILWYDSTSEKSFNSVETFDGSIVSTWHDLNPNVETVRNNATATSSNEPTYRTNKINGLPAVEFTRANSDFMSFNGTNIANSNFTIFVVEQRTSDDSDNYFISGSDSPDNTNLSLGYKTNNTATISLINNGLDTTVDPYTNPIARIHTFTFNYNTKTYKINGESKALSPVGGSPNASQPTTSFSNAALGFSSILSSYYQGNIAEVIIFKKYLSTNDLKSVENYLGKKWKISLVN